MIMQRSVEGVRTRNVRLEAYLKRTLDIDKYERIRTHDSCIVCSEKEDKQFKFIVLSDEWIYLTENPPKKLQKVIHLGDIVSMEVMPDKPEFLSGQEKENAQHLVIGYLTDGGVLKNRSKNKTNKTPASSRTSRSDTTMSYSTRSEGLGISRVLDDENQYEEFLSSSFKALNPQALSFTARYEDQSATSTPVSRSGARPASARTASERPMSARNSARRALMDLISADDVVYAGDVTQAINDQGKTTSRSWRENLSNFLLLTSRNNDENGGKLNGINTLNVATGGKSLSARDAKSVEVQSDVKESNSILRDSTTPTEKTSKPVVNGESTNKEKQSKSNGKKNKKKVKINEGDNGVLNDKLAHQSADRNDDEAEDDDDVTVPPLDLTSVTEDVSPSASPTSKSIFLNPSLDDSINAVDILQTAKIHVYVLRPTSSILMLLRCAWLNYLIKGTLEDDPLCKKRCKYFPPRDGPGISEKLETLFAQMKTEILNPHKTEEDCFQLVLELKVAGSRNFIIKRFFWRTGELFQWMVQQIQSCVKGSAAGSRMTQQKSAAGLSVKSAVPEPSIDKLEYLLLLLECLTSMFCETEIFSSRTQYVKVNDGRVLTDLIHSLTYFPVTLTVAANSDMVGLAAELTAKVVDLLYELIHMTHQSNWADDETSWLKVRWIVSRLEDQSDECMALVNRLVEQGLLYISTNHNSGRMDRDEAVLLYKLFVVLDTLTNNSDQILNHIKQNYHEEFKYYVDVSVAEQNIPVSYLTRTLTLTSIRTVVKRVLFTDLSLLRRHIQSLK